MKKLYIFLCLFLLCISLAACAGAKRHSLLSPIAPDSGEAVIDIVETERSKIDIPETTAVTTIPHYFEVVATGTTASTTKKEPAKTEPQKEYFTVKFVDTDGYTAISVQTVAEGESATEPPMPDQRGDMIFRGWDKDFSKIKSGMIVKAIYQKEWLTVRFFDADASLLKSTEVRYGEAAVPPEVLDKGEYMFDGWSALFDNVTSDLDIYATYYILPQREFITLEDAFSIFSIKQDTSTIPSYAYYRKSLPATVTIGKKEYSGNIVFGNFADTISVEGYGFTSLEGTLLLDEDTDSTAALFLLKFSVYVDGKEKYSTELTKLGTSRNFSVDIEGAKEITVRLETIVDDYIYYGNVPLVGGLVNTSLYK